MERKTNIIGGGRGNNQSIYIQQFQPADSQLLDKHHQRPESKIKSKHPRSGYEPTAAGLPSLSFYSITNHFVQASQDDQAEYFDDLYRLADSTNSEAWYFSALINTRKII